jgi:DUF1680 family protein
MNRRQAVKTLLTTAAVAAGDAASGWSAPLAEREDKLKPLSPGGVSPFPLHTVRLLDGPFRDAMERDRAYLTSLEPDRFLHNFRANAGLAPKAPIYGGWESEGVAGHVLGHYLSACSLMYQSTGDPIMKQRVDYIADELALCQAQDPTGYVSAIPNGKAIFAAVAAGDGGAISRGWVPWYTQHKVMAGLRDAYRLCGNETAKTTLVKLSDWTDATTRVLTDAENQKMLGTEHGGMNEVLADVYALTGDAKYLATARRFYHRRVLDPLTEGRDTLDGLHSNTQIPKVIGLARIHELTGDAASLRAARFFYDTVVGTRSYAIGGNGDYEHFFPPKEFDRHLDSSATAETCCTYNMLKLNRQLFAQQPSAAYADYYERALYNQILASQEHEKGMMTYFSPMRPGHFKVYCSPTESFWCCTGTGIENHAKYGDSIYFHDVRSLYINLFIPSELNWREKGLTLRQDTQFPTADTTRLTLTGARIAPVALKIRYPGWATDATVKVNGKTQPLAGATPGSYITLDRAWKTGDVIDVHLPMHVHAEPLPGSARHHAVLYGPIVLAGDMGREGLDQLPDFTGSHQENKYAHLPALPVSAFVGTPADIARKIEPVPGKPLTFRTAGLAQPSEVTLIPYYEVHHRRYNLYWNVYSPEDWKTQQVALAQAERVQREMAARIVDEFRPGEQQSEVDHHFVGQNSKTDSFSGRKWRDAEDGGYFAFTLNVAPNVPQELNCTFWGNDGGSRTFDISIDGKRLATETLDRSKPNEFFEKSYPIPPDLIAGKDSVIVRFQAHPGNFAGGIFACRMLRQHVATIPRA